MDQDAINEQLIQVIGTMSTLIDILAEAVGNMDESAGIIRSQQRRVNMEFGGLVLAVRSKP